MQRGEIWWAALGRPFGSEPGYRRPVLVIQTEDFNESAIRTVVVVALTSNVRLAKAPGNVLCRRKDTGLTKNSVVNVSQVATIDKRQLTARVGMLPKALFTRVEMGLRLVLGL